MNQQLIHNQRQVKSLSEIKKGDVLVKIYSRRPRSQRRELFQVTEVIKPSGKYSAVIKQRKLHFPTHWGKKWNRFEDTTSAPDCGLAAYKDGSSNQTNWLERPTLFDLLVWRCRVWRVQHSQ